MTTKSLVGAHTIKHCESWQTLTYSKDGPAVTLSTMPYIVRPEIFLQNPNLTLLCSFCVISGTSMRVGPIPAPMNSTQPPIQLPRVSPKRLGCWFSTAAAGWKSEGETITTRLGLSNPCRGIRLGPCEFSSLILFLLFGMFFTIELLICRIGFSLVGLGGEGNYMGRRTGY